mgnify:CR=1 FL=1
MIKPPNKMGICARLEKNIKKIEVPFVEYYNIKLELYIGNLIVVNGLKCDTMHSLEDTFFVICKTKLGVPSKMTREQALFLMNND